jgi:hypothetical protein
MNIKDFKESVEMTEYALKQGYTILDLSDKMCKRCDNIVYHEKHGVITNNEYPYYCIKCDENMYSFEVDL